MSKIVCVDGFAARQFDDPEYVGTKIVGCSKKEMEDRVNAALHADGSRLVDGYAPFCKHVFLKNDFTETKCAAVEISAENEAMLQTGYQGKRFGSYTRVWLGLTVSAFVSCPLGNSAHGEGASRAGALVPARAVYGAQGRVA